MIVVVNAGTLPAPKWVADAYSRRGEEVVYLTSFGIPADSRMMRAVPVDGLRRQLARRQLPEALPRRTVRSLAPVVDVLATVAVQRGSTRWAVRLLARRNAVFQKRASAFLRKNAAAIQLVLTPAGSSLRVLETCAQLGLPTLLYMPLPHFAFGESLLADELTDNPDWSPYLQSAEVAADRRDLLTRELELSSAALAASSFVERSLREEGYRKPVVVVPLGCDLEEFGNDDGRGSGDPTTAEGAASQTLEILYVGMLTQRKGLSYLLDAVRSLSGTRRVRLTLVGPDYKGARKHVESTYPDLDIRFMASLSKPQLARLYRSSDVFVFPTLLEGFGLTVIEALAHGLPVVVTANCCGPDLGIDGVAGRIVPARDAAAIATAVEGIVGDPQRRAVLADAARDVAARFTWRQFQADALERIDDVRAMT